MPKIKAAPFWHVYLIAETSREDESIKNHILECVQGGVTAVQLRLKGKSFDHRLALGKLLKPELQRLGIPLIVNDSLELAQAVGADGLHVGKTDVSIQVARDTLGPAAFLGLSVGLHDAFETLPYHLVDYLAASPVFATPTKADAGYPFGLAKLQQLCRISRVPVVAIGGLNLLNAPTCIQAGAGGLALVTALMESPAPHKDAAKWAALWRTKSSFCGPPP